MEQFRVDQRAERLYLHLAGEVTFDVAAELRRKVEAMLQEHVFEVLVVDLADVPFMDSTGIGTLVALNSKVYGAGKRFALLNVGDRVKKTLELVKLLDFFITAHDEGELDVKLMEAR